MKNGNDKLTAALAAYEKERPVSTDAELEEALLSIMEKELGKEGSDVELIDAAADELTVLRGEDPARVRAEAEENAKKRFPAMKDRVASAKDNKRTKIRFALLAAALTAVIIALLALALGTGKAPAPTDPVDTDRARTTEAEPGGDPAPTDETATDVEPIPAETRATVLPPESGAGEDFHLIYDDIFLGKDAALPEAMPSNLPVFCDRYGNGQGGPTVDFTDEEEASLYEKARECVAEFFGEETAAGMTVSEGDVSAFGDVFILRCDFPDKPYELEENMHDAAIRLNGYSFVLPEDYISDEGPYVILNNEFVAHAVRYAGIVSPAAIRTCYEYYADGERRFEVRYLITDKIDPEYAEMNASVTLSMSTAGFWTVTVLEYRVMENVGEYAVIPYEEALDAARAHVKEHTGEDLPLAAATLTYVSREVWDGASSSVYRVPAYRFFFRGTEDGETAYGTVDVTATVFTPTVRK